MQEKQGRKGWQDGRGYLSTAVNQQNRENPLLSLWGLTLADEQALAVFTNHNLHNARLSAGNKSLTQDIQTKLDLYHIHLLISHCWIGHWGKSLLSCFIHFSVVYTDRAHNSTQGPLSFCTALGLQENSPYCGTGHTKNSPGSYTTILYLHYKNFKCGQKCSWPTEDIIRQILQAPVLLN